MPKVERESAAPPKQPSPQDFITTHESFPGATVFYLGEVIELMMGYAEQYSEFWREEYEFEHKKVKRLERTNASS